LRITAPHPADLPFLDSAKVDRLASGTVPMYSPTKSKVRIVMMKHSILAAMVSTALAFPMTANAQEGGAPVGKLNFTGGSVAAGLGFSWGSGTLTFKGKTYNVKVTGFAVGDVGVASIDATGDVYNLTDIANFDGNYAAAGIGGTIAGGGTVMAMENPHGVVIQVRSTTAGLHLNLGPSGITFTINQ
jgi:hypothetical protein